MKKVLFLLLGFYSFSCANAQLITNYVKNPDFEKYDACPTDYDQINRANFWSSVDSTKAILKGACQPEYCNVCATTSSKVNVPFSY